MTCDFLRPTLIELAHCQPYGDDGALVDTTCLFPSGKVVQVLVKSNTSNSFLVTDCGSAVGELELSGLEIETPDKILRQFARKYGVKAEGGALFENGVSHEDLPSAIRQVANACQEAVARELATYKFHPHRQLKELFAQFIERSYGKSFTSRVVQGKNRSHLFDY